MGLSIQDETVGTAGVTTALVTSTSQDRAETVKSTGKAASATEKSDDTTKEKEAKKPSKKKAAPKEKPTKTLPPLKEVC